MKKTLLLSLFMMLAWAARAVDVTFVAPEGYRLQNVIVDGDELSGAYDEATNTVTYMADLEPGQHGLTAELSQDNDGSTLYFGMGGEQTFTVGNTPLTVTYGPDNYCQIHFTVTDENGQPLPGMNIEITSDEQSYVIVTEVGNGAYSAYVPADFGTFTYTASGQHYAPLSQTAEVKGEEMNLTVSYAAYRRITLSVPAFDYSTGNQLTLKLFGQSNDATESQVSFTQTLYDGELETYNVVPQGTYSCRAEDVSAETYTPVRVALQNVTVGESDASVSLDLNASVLLSTDFTDITDTLGVSFYILPEGCTTASEAIGVNGRSSISLSAGKYYLYGNLNGLDGYSYSFNRTIDLTTPVSLRLERADFHKVQLAFEGLNVEVPIVTVEHAGCEGLFGATFSDNSYFLGDFTYAIRAVWIDDYSYAMPYAYSGRVSVSTADVTTKADLSNMRAFKARLKYGDASAIIFTDASGATGELTFLTEDMGILLPVGTYSITSWLSPLYCTISVPDDCPEYIDFIYSFKPTGIHSTAQAQGLTARAEAGGLRMVAPQGGRVSVSVFDLSGRRVITGQAADGEVVSTAALTPGVYVARLTAGNAAATVKFTVH